MRKLAGAPVGEPGAIFVAPLADLGGEAVVEARVVAEGDLGMVVEPLVHGLLRLGADEMVAGRDVQHQGIGDGVLLAQQVVDPNGVVADAGVAIGPRRGHECEPPAEAVADHADFGAPFRVARVADRRLDIAHPLVLVEPAHQLERGLEFILDVRIKLDVGLEPAEQVGGEREVAFGGELVAFAANAGVHPENLLDYHDRRARLACRPREVAIEVAIAAKGGNADGVAHIGSSRVCFLHTLRIGARSAREVGAFGERP